LRNAKRVLVAGATGYIGRAVVRELVAQGFATVALVRQLSADARIQHALEGAELRVCDVCKPNVAEQGLRGEPFDAVISCLASRSGAAEDAWRVDYAANANLLAASTSAQHFILLSAICVQKPLLEFQHAKLAFEQKLQESGLRYSIIRPTAYFKSLAGQVARVQQGKPFVVFGDGELTACKPISEADLARFIVDCIEDAEAHNRVLPLGGPGPALTPLQQGAMLCELAGRPLRLRHVPLRLMDGIIRTLALLSRVYPPLADKTELARIGRYYATESMLLWNSRTQSYDAAATPEYGDESLRDFYRRVLDEGLAGQELGEHAVFDRAQP
jgi:divinyl chlorophyllide a 8-vinyl-reductase